MKFRVCVCVCMCLCIYPDQLCCMYVCVYCRICSHFKQPSSRSTHTNFNIVGHLSTPRSFLVWKSLYSVTTRVFASVHGQLCELVCWRSILLLETRLVCHVIPSISLSISLFANRWSHGQSNVYHSCKQQGHNPNDDKWRGCVRQRSTVPQVGQLLDPVALIASPHSHFFSQLKRASDYPLCNSSHQDFSTRVAHLLRAVEVPEDDEELEHYLFLKRFGLCVCVCAMALSLSLTPSRTLAKASLACQERDDYAAQKEEAREAKKLQKLGKRSRAVEDESVALKRESGIGAAVFRASRHRQVCVCVCVTLFIHISSSCMRRLE